MIDIILQAMKKNNITTYRINTEEVESVELYFIKKELDMRRKKKVTHYEVTVYRDFEKDGVSYRGFSSLHVFPEMDAQQVEKAVADAYFAASFVCNPYFALRAGKKEDLVQLPGKLSTLSLDDTVTAFAKALYSADTRKDSFINSSEFFVTRKKVSILDSAGTDVSYMENKVTGEFVVQCKEPKDVELYQDFSYLDLDTEALTKQATEALETVCARAKAQSAPAKGDYTVILSGKEMQTLLSLYNQRACTSAIYAGYSNYKTGMQLQGDDTIGEKLNITLKAVTPYSYEGIPMKDMELLQNGTLKNIYGNTRFCYYMGVEPTGLYEAMSVDNGTKSLEEMKKEPYLHVVSFSDFHMDALSGYFGGEIRLAYLYDGEKVTPVTGGSINGNLLELQKDLTFSTERYKDSTYDGPFAVCLHHVPVAGT